MQQITDEIADNEENFRLQITKLETQLGHMKPNLAAIAEYRKKVSLLFSISRHFFSLLVYSLSLLFAVASITGMCDFITTPLCEILT